MPTLTGSRECNEFTVRGYDISDLLVYCTNLGGRTVQNTVTHRKTVNIIYQLNPFFFPDTIIVREQQKIYIVIEHCARGDIGAMIDKVRPQANSLETLSNSLETLSRSIARTHALMQKEWWSVVGTELERI